MRVTCENFKLHMYELLSFGFVGLISVMFIIFHIYLGKQYQISSILVDYFSCQRENPGTKIQKTIKHMILYVMFLIYLDIWDLVCPCLLCPCYLSLSWLYFFFFEINALFNACHHWRWQKFSWIPLCSAGLHVWGKMVCHLPMSALLMRVLLEYSRFSKQIIWDKRNLQ